MELALSLGDTPKGLSINLDKATTTRLGNKDPFFIALGDANHSSSEGVDETSDPPLQLDLLPFTPLSRPHLPSLSHSHSHSHSHSYGGGGGRALDVNRLPVGVEEAEDGTPVSSSPNSVSSFQMEFCIRNSMVGSRNKREHEGEGERDCSRGSDDEDNGSTRKKLRLSKEQSAFLEESFKEHTTLNPKQKLALAKQLNLRPRQVEVWFQNRRARTKLKQTEVDCEYLKRCCETLTEENRRLQKELQELRALKTSQPFYMQLPATTLTMCPSCERVATTTTNNVSQPPPPLRSIANPRLSSSPFHNNTQAQAQTHQAHPPSS